MADPDLHEDFARLTVNPGESHITGRDDQFALLNLLAMGGAADRPTHIPSVIAQVGDLAVWQSTGAADALPFWNTNYTSDIFLYLVTGEVKMAFKETEGEREYGFYLGRTGDLMKLPQGIAHRTWATEPRRRISMEILRRNPLWERIGQYGDVEPAASPEVGAFVFGVDGQLATIDSPAGRTTAPLHFFRRGLQALVAYELHLEHNEFDGGFVLHDLDDHVVLKVPGHREELAPGEILAAFKSFLVRAG